jgi:hypothetical protein
MNSSSRHPPKRRFFLENCHHVFPNCCDFCRAIGERSHVAWAKTDPATTTPVSCGRARSPLFLIHTAPVAPIVQWNTSRRATLETQGVLPGPYNRQAERLIDPSAGILPVAHCHEARSRASPRPNPAAQRNRLAQPSKLARIELSHVGRISRIAMNQHHSHSVQEPGDRICHC